MKCAVFKTTYGGALVSRICDEQGLVISTDIDKHLDRIVEENPNLISWRITDHLNLPGGHSNDQFDNTFKEAFTDELLGDQVDVDLPAAVLIAHIKRRVKRSGEYKEVDGDVMHVAVTLAGQVKRDTIQIKYDRIQIDLDEAADVDALKAVMILEGLI